METKLIKHNLRVTLGELTGDYSNSAGNGIFSTELGEVISATVSYALNSVPSAVITMPAGTSLVTKASDSLWQLQRASKAHQPVGLFLEYFGDSTGWMPSKKACIFKGYISNIAQTRTVESIVYQIQLTHWLQDITLCSVLNPISAPGNSLDLAMTSYFQIDVDSTEQRADANAMGKGLTWIVTADVKMNEPLFNSIKNVFIKNMKPSADRESVVRDVLARSLEALDLIKAENTDIAKALSYGAERSVIETKIQEAITSEVAQQYYSKTLWDKMVDHLLPKFFLTLVPGVNESYVIPKPGLKMTRGTKKQPLKKIPLNEYSTLNTSKATAPILGGFILAAPTNMITFSSDSGESLVKSSLTNIMWPEKPVDGPIRVCSLPTWLISNEESYFTGLVNSMATDLFRGTNYTEDAVKVAREAKTEQKKAAAKSDSTIEEFCKAYVKSAFQGYVFQQRMCVLAGPLRFDIMPGTPVRYELPIRSGEKQQFSFATVNTVTIQITSTLAATSFTLDNIRDEFEIDSNIYSSADGLLYEESWLGNHTLYQEM